MLCNLSRGDDGCAKWNLLNQEYEYKYRDSTYHNGLEGGIVVESDLCGVGNLLYLGNDVLVVRLHNLCAILPEHLVMLFCLINSGVISLKALVQASKVLILSI